MSALPSTGKAQFIPPALGFVLSNAAITIALAGIRAGKTHAGAFKTITYALNNPCKADEVHLVCSPTYPMSKVPVEKIFALLHDESIFPRNPLIRYIKSERMFLLACGDGRITRIKVVSLHDPHKVRGIKALSAWVDEGAYINSEGWDIIQGRVADSNGPIWITTTPAGYNFIHELYERAVSEKRDGIPLDARHIRVFHWTSLQNSFIDHRGLARLANAYDPQTYAQEIGARFVRNQGAVYHSFTKDNVVQWKFNPKLPVYIGQDFNVSAMASAFAQPFTNRFKQPGLAFFHDRLQPNSDTFGLIEYLNHWCDAHSISKSQVVIFPDASGNQRSTSGKSDFKVLKEAGYKISVGRKNPFVKDRINCTNGLLKPQTGFARLIVDPSAVNIIRTLEKQIWTEDDPPKPDKEHGLDHMGDAVGYCAWGKFPLKASLSLGTPKRQVRGANGYH